VKKVTCDVTKSLFNLPVIVAAIVSAISQFFFVLMYLNNEERSENCAAVHKQGYGWAMTI
jgi:hypothetical protein